MDERIEEEIEALKAILMDEVIVKHDGNGTATIETDIFPATASDYSSQYVRVTLVASLPKNYPDVSPIVDLKNPRGLDDSVLQIMRKKIKSKMENLIGEPVIFELIEVIRDHLTESNLPSCPCVICLYGFSENDEFVKTQCYHYFHSYCLACHIKASEKIFKEEQEKLPVWQQTTSFQTAWWEATIIKHPPGVCNAQPKCPKSSFLCPSDSTQTQRDTKKIIIDRKYRVYSGVFKCFTVLQQRCPVCRDIISVDLDELSKAAPPIERENARNFELDENLLSLQKEMAALFKHQQSRGGIIDLEAEESKLLLVTSLTTEEHETSAGPSVHQNSSAPVSEAEGGDSRRVCSRGGRGNRGAFAAARKNRGCFYSASR